MELGRPCGLDMGCEEVGRGSDLRGPSLSLSVGLLVLRGWGGGFLQLATLSSARPAWLSPETPGSGPGPDLGEAGVY